MLNFFFLFFWHLVTSRKRCFRYKSNLTWELSVSFFFHEQQQNYHSQKYRWYLLTISFATIGTLRNVFLNEGVRGCYRGLGTTTMVRTKWSGMRRKERENKCTRKGALNVTFFLQALVPQWGVYFCMYSHFNSIAYNFFGTNREREKERAWNCFVTSNLLLSLRISRHAICARHVCDNSLSHYWRFCVASLDGENKTAGQME